MLLPRTFLRITNEVCTDIETTEHSFVRWQRTVHIYTYTLHAIVSLLPRLPHQLTKPIVPAPSSHKKFRIPVFWVVTLRQWVSGS